MGLKTPLETALANQLRNGGIKLRRVLGVALHRMKDRRGSVLQLGTGCSGSDLIVEVACTLSKQWKSSFGVDIKFQHIMSVESEPWKQD